MNSRSLPFSEEAERGALGSILLEPVRVMGIAKGDMQLPLEAFHLPAHRDIYAVLCEMAAKDTAGIDLLTATDALARTGKRARWIDRAGPTG